MVTIPIVPYPVIHNPHGPTRPPPEFNTELLLGPPNHLRSLILGSCMVPYPIIHNPHGPTRPPPEFNIKLLYSSYPMIHNLHGPIQPPPEFNIKLLYSSLSHDTQSPWAHPTISVV